MTDKTVDYIGYCDASGGKSSGYYGFNANGEIVTPALGDVETAQYFYPDATII